jgi:hypothetical protein
MNDFISSASNTLVPTVLPAADILRMIEKYRKEEGDVFKSIGDAFSMGCAMADYFIKIRPEKESADNPIEKIYEKYQHTLFIGEKAGYLQGGKTIGMIDLTNRRFLFLLQEGSGCNQVYYMKTQEGAPVAVIDLLAKPVIRRLSRIETGWRDGNNFDKVVVANFFGYDYDKKDDEIIVPEGIIESPFKLAMKSAQEAILAEQIRTESAE